MDFEEVIEWVGKAVDGAGVAVIVIGGLAATAQYAMAAREPDGYKCYRHRLGRAILLGLEFLVAGDIIRTVAVRPTFTSVGVLAVIVVIRTFLSFSLETEISGRLPWQAGRGS